MVSRKVITAAIKLHVLLIGRYSQSTPCIYMRDVIASFDQLNLNKINNYHFPPNMENYKIPQPQKIPQTTDTEQQLAVIIIIARGESEYQQKECLRRSTVINSSDHTSTNLVEVNCIAAARCLIQSVINPVSVTRSSVDCCCRI